MQHRQHARVEHRVPESGGEARGKPRSITQVAIATFVGTSIEWYDFFLYGTAAALVFNKLFFPTFDPLVGTLAAYGTFAVGFIARPIGGIVCGHFGDRTGRKTMLYVTLLVMGTATALIGVLPDYATIGIWAPIALLVLRLMQGFGVGGEWGGAVLMAVEHAPAGKRGFYGSWPQIGVPAGLLLANLVYSVFSSVPEPQFLAWGWRFPFLFSIVLIAVGLFVRMRVAESPLFNRVRESHSEARVPLIEAVRAHPRSVLLAMGARFAENGFFYIFTTFVLTYVTQALKLPASIALTGVLLAAAVQLFAMPAFGALSDSVGRRPVYLFGAGFCLLFSFPFFWLVDTREPSLIWLAITLGLTLGHAAMYGPQASFLSELFGTRVRYSGASLGYQLASVFAGGLSPIIATELLRQSGGNPAPISVYLVVMAAITLVAVFLASETLREDIAQDRSLAAPHLRGTVREGRRPTGTLSGA